MELIPSGKLQAVVSFAEFYGLYPRHNARKDAEKAWSQIGPENQAKAIAALPVHIKAWQAKGTETQFIPLPATWLRGWRWEDEIEPPPKKVKLSVVAWWTSPAGIIAEGARLGLTARPGESINEFKARIEAKL